MNFIQEKIKEDHKTFKWHYKEILYRESRNIFKVQQSTTKEDMLEGFDYKIKFQKKEVAVRNREFGAQKYLDFTIRASSNGYDSEIQKIRKGCGDLYLYVWQTECGSSIDYYMIIDLEAFRSSGLADSDRIYKQNPDGITGFYAYSFAELAKNKCIISFNKFNSMWKVNPESLHDF